MRALFSLFVLALAPQAAAADSAYGKIDDGRAPPAETSRYWQVHGSMLMGTGLRFNNPYRLQTILGEDAQSVSRTAFYTDFGVGVTYGKIGHIAHGGALRMTLALEGVQQTILTPSYLAFYRTKHFGFDFRAGTSIVASPDLGFGLELVTGAIWFVRSGIGLTAEVAGNIFWGAGTEDVAVPAYPILSAQLGIAFAYEVLP